MSLCSLSRSSLFVTASLTFPFCPVFVLREPVSSFSCCCYRRRCCSRCFRCRCCLVNQTFEHARVSTGDISIVWPSSAMGLPSSSVWLKQARSAIARIQRKKRQKERIPPLASRPVRSVPSFSSVWVSVCICVPVYTHISIASVGCRGGCFGSRCSNRHAGPIGTGRGGGVTIAFASALLD